MAKIKRIGDKKEILKRRQEAKDHEMCIDTIAGQSEKQLEKWFKKHFSVLPKEAREGLDVIVKALWANTKVKQKKDGAHSPK
ncbi:MAG: hypothetical protein GY940_06085 [bacterium]|nr:hypothetical protein [bacterium]